MVWGVGPLRMEPLDGPSDFTRKEKWLKLEHFSIFQGDICDYTVMQSGDPASAMRYSKTN